MNTHIDNNHQPLLMRNEGLFASAIQDELVMMSDDNACYYGLNATARLIWELLDQPLTQDQLVSELSARFEASDETLAADLKVFIATMLKEKLLIQAETH